MKYIIRDGFIASVATKATGGKTYDKLYVGGETVDMEDDVAALHMHKLELADPKDRAAALKAEQAKKAASFSGSDPALLVQQLTAALAASQKAPKE